MLVHPIYRGFNCFVVFSDDDRSLIGISTPAILSRYLGVILVVFVIWPLIYDFIKEEDHEID